MANMGISVFAAFVLLAFAVTTLAAPQLELDYDQGPHEGLVEGLTRTRRGSEHPLQPVPPYGHHQPTYDGGHGQGHRQGGHGHGGHQPIGPVFTFVRTDYHGNFQTGVRHKVGGGGGGGWRH